jgi:hypothetical protein
MGSVNHRQPAEALTTGDIDQIAFANGFPKTSARSGSVFCPQGIATSDFFVAAIAGAQPGRFLSLSGCPALPCDNSQIAKPAARKVVSSRAIAIGYRHMDNVSGGMSIVQWRTQK